MKRIAFLSLALISIVAAAATRPHYGGTLRVEMRSAPSALELPPLSSPADYREMALLLSLVGDNIVTIDAEDRAQPALALAWRSDSTSHHWQFTLRHGLMFHDGTAASASAIAQILGPLHPEWTIRASGDSLTIDTESPANSLLPELASPRNLILTRGANGTPIGTGAFRIAEFQPGRTLKLAATEDSWAGRPFLDAIEIEFGKSLRDQAVALDLGRADAVEAAPETVSPRARASSSLPIELMVLVFTSNSKAQDVRLRKAIALSIDRKPVQSALLKGAGEATASLLPNWMTGYASAFSTQPNVQRAKALLAESRIPALTLSYDPRDPQGQLIAERIALNAREAGISIQVSLSGQDDLRLLRVALPSPDPALTLREIARQLSLPEPLLSGNSIEQLYRAERALLEENDVIPLFHLPKASAVGARVQGWVPDRLGAWNAGDLWLGEMQNLGDSRLENSR